MNTSSPKSSLVKLGLYPKPKTFKVMVLGQSGVGKSALVVRFITKRFIGEYDPSLEKVYTHQVFMDNEVVYFEVLDSAGDTHESEYLSLETHIRWAEAFILMYSVTDKCSFDECHRLKFLINYNKKRRRLTSTNKDNALEVPVILVGNKTDQSGDRMVSTEEGQQRSKEIGCVCFHEISVRESIEQVWNVFRDARRFWRVHNKSPRLRRSLGSTENAPELHPAALARAFARADGLDEPDSETNSPQANIWTETDLQEGEMDDELGVVSRSDSTSSSGREDMVVFRERASTDSNLAPLPTRSRHPPEKKPQPLNSGLGRRMSVSMRGDLTSY